MKCNETEILRLRSGWQLKINIVISTGTQWSGEIYLETDFSAALHSARNDGNSREISQALPLTDSERKIVISTEATRSGEIYLVRFLHYGRNDEPTKCALVVKILSLKLLHKVTYAFLQISISNGFNECRTDNGSVSIRTSLIKSLFITDSEADHRRVLQV